MDLKLIAGNFLDDVLPKDKQHLLKHYRSEHQRRFITYYLNFAELRERSPKHFYKNFIDHTGIACTERSMQSWIKKFHALESALQKATEQFDFETIEQIKSGRYRV